MDWVKLGTRYYLDPAVASLPDADTEMLFVRGLAYSGAEETEGFIPEVIVPSLIRRRRYGAAVEALVARSLWIPSTGDRGQPGYRISRWEDWQEELDSLARRRANDRERKRRQRQADRESDQLNDVSRDTSTGQSRGCPPPIEEEREPQNATRSSVGRARAARIPGDFTVTPEMVTWARENAPHVDGRRETDRFTDYWRAAGGANARKRDWPATWRNWMRRAEDDLAARPQQRPTRKQETDDLFARAMERARTRDAQEVPVDPRGNGHAGPLHPRMLPPAGD